MATYYIRSDGSDSASGANDTTDPTTGAWLTLGKISGAAVTAGDTVKFHRGHTWSGTQFTPKAGITYEATSGTDAKPIITNTGLRTVHVNGVQGVTLSDLDIRGGTTALAFQSSGDTTQCVFNRLDVTTSVATGKSIWVYESVGTFNDCTSDGATVSNPWIFATNATPESVVIVTTVTLNNCIGKNSFATSSGFFQGNSSIVTCNNCTAYNNLEDGFSANNTGSLTCNKCVSYGNGNDARATSGDGYTSHDTSTLNLYNCLAWNNQKSGVAMSGSSGGVIYFCTFVNNYDVSKAGTGGGLSFTATYVGTCVAKNNITMGHDYELNVANAGTTNLTLDNNCYYGSRAGITNRFCYQSTKYTTFASYRAAVPTQDVNSQSADPKLTGTGAGGVTDFKLLSSSPCLGAGTYIAGVTTDYAGRPYWNETHGVSMGAYNTVARTRTTGH